MEDPFLVALDGFIDKAKVNTDLAVQAIAQEALARVKELTPVKTGYLRANWTVIRGGGAQAFAGPEAGGDERVASSQNTILQLKAGDYFTLVNPVRYAARIEYGFVGRDSLGRNYDQKGAGMLQQTITEMPQIAARALERLGR